jgi:hypothetical protein
MRRSNALVERVVMLKLPTHPPYFNKVFLSFFLFSIQNRAVMQRRRRCCVDSLFVFSDSWYAVRGV